ncbi:hypothetical protein ACSV9I_07490 [Rhizobium sp. G187]
MASTSAWLHAARNALDAASLPRSIFTVSEGKAVIAKCWLAGKWMRGP